MRSISVKTRNEVTKLIQEGMPVKMVAMETGVSRTSIRNICNENGVKIPKCVKRDRRTVSASEIDLMIRLREKGCTLDFISMLLDRNHMVVSRYLNENGISTSNYNRMSRVEPITLDETDAIELLLKINDANEAAIDRSTKMIRQHNKEAGIEDMEILVPKSVPNKDNEAKLMILLYCFTRSLEIYADKPTDISDVLNTIRKEVKREFSVYNERLMLSLFNSFAYVLKRITYVKQISYICDRIKVAIYDHTNIKTYLMDFDSVLKTSTEEESK